MKKLALLLILLSAGSAGQAGVPSTYLAAAMAAMGGESKLRGITAIEYRAVGASERTVLHRSLSPARNSRSGAAAHAHRTSG